MKRLLAPLLLVPALAALGGCATLAEGDDPDPGKRTVAVEVENSTASTMTVWLHPDVGVRQLLGTILPGEMETHEAGIEPGERYRLEAEITGDADIFSEPFVLPMTSERVFWDLGANIIQFP